MMSRALAASAVALLLASASARAADTDFTVSQADYPDPGDATMAVEDRQSPDSIEIALLRDAFEHIKAGQTARLSGREDDARDEDRKSATILASFVDKYPSHRNRLVLLRMSTERFLNAREWEKAAETAQRMIADKDAKPVTKAIASRYAAGGWQMVAVTDMKSGKLPPLKLVPYGARQGQPAQPRVPDLPWRMFIEAADTYAKYKDADPTAKLSAEEKKARGGTDAAQLELIAAQVLFGYDNMEAAQRRFARLVNEFPGRADLMESAVPFYLDTFQFTGDKAGLKAALEKLEPAMTAESKRAISAAVAPGATDAQKKEAAVFAKLAAEVRDAAKGGDYSNAAELMASGDASAKQGQAADAAKRYAEAGALFEKFAADNKDNPDAPNALFNAGIAYDKAKDGKKAVAARQRLVNGYPEAKVIPQALLLLGQGLIGEKDYAGAAAAYTTYLEKAPQGAQRCMALQNAGYALTAAGKKADGLARYQAFSADATCTQDDPNAAARVLYETGKSLSEAKRDADARKVFQTLVDLKGVTGVVEKSYQADAAKRLKDGAKAPKAKK